MSWEDSISELEMRKRLAREMGGEERVSKHKSLGKLTVRARVDMLLDSGSFQEIGSITGSAIYGPDGSLEQFTIHGAREIDSGHGSFPD